LSSDSHNFDGGATQTHLDSMLDTINRCKLIGSMPPDILAEMVHSVPNNTASSVQVGIIASGDRCQQYGYFCGQPNSSPNCQLVRVGSLMPGADGVVRVFRVITE